MRSTLEDESFDMAGSQFGVMLFPDMPKGIREMARVVRPGGRVADDRLWRSARDRVHRLLRGRDPLRSPGLRTARRSIRRRCPFQLAAAPSGCAEELAAAGLPTDHVETITETHRVRSRQRSLGMADLEQSASPRRCSPSSTSPMSERDVIRQALETLVRERAGGDRHGAALPIRSTSASASGARPPHAALTPRLSLR